MEIGRRGLLVPPRKRMEYMLLVCIHREYTKKCRSIEKPIAVDVARRVVVVCVMRDDVENKMHSKREQKQKSRDTLVKYK